MLTSPSTEAPTASHVEHFVHFHGLLAAAPHVFSVSSGASPLSPTFFDKVANPPSQSE